MINEERVKQLFKIAVYEQKEEKEHLTLRFVDDLLLNTLGFAVGYGLYLLCRKIRKAKKVDH